MELEGLKYEDARLRQRQQEIHMLRAMLNAEEHELVIRRQEVIAEIGKIVIAEQYGKPEG